MAELLRIEKSGISKHLKNIFDTAETNFYNLDAIISVGYRVNSKRANQFRIWATKKSR